MNSKLPDIEGTGTTRIALKCQACGGIIPCGSIVVIRVSYNFYYDHCQFYHPACPRPAEMSDKPTPAV